MQLAVDIFWGAVRRLIYAVAFAVVWWLAGRVVRDLLGWEQLPTSSWWGWVVASTVMTWFWTMWFYLRSYSFICPVCQNRDEPMGLLAYWRGHGAHEWHQGYVR